ncbi:hypothetical protein ACYOEI_00425 [Singulisphaera rosea]
MERPAFTLLQACGFLALFAFTFIALNHPSENAILILLYVDLTFLVFGTFRARYASQQAADWWFGFAAFGWGHLILTSLNFPSGLANGGLEYAHMDVKLWDLSGSFGMWLNHTFPRPDRNDVAYARVASLLFNMFVAFLGGNISSAIAFRMNRTRASSSVSEEISQTESSGC